MNEEFRRIPGYECYSVTNYGKVKSVVRDLVLSQYELNGYMIVDTFRGSLTETLPVHRAVALAWVNNPSIDNFTIVNHLDGIPKNNWFENLEWTNCSGNNYHAVNTGLRVDNIPCLLRDFSTGSIYNFSSMAQAAEYMGLRKDTPIASLYPKMFGKLIANRYEFRFANDPTPWFYENRTELVPPSRYMVTVNETNGEVKELYSSKNLLKEYQLYGSPGKSIPDLARYGNEIYPDKSFSVRDSYNEVQFRTERQTRESNVMEIVADFDDSTIIFESLTQCASYFNVDRSTILTRLNVNVGLDGCIFTYLPH